ncbi:hypothetical protein HDU96_008100 [Phlyctochytrium bullatum]|nr:hypothetical protein HDU96_008100 [Phlyctochytrium bullatum]
MKATVITLTLSLALTAAVAKPFARFSGDAVSLDDLAIDIPDNNLLADVSNNRAAIADAFATEVNEDRNDIGSPRAPDDTENFGLSRAAKVITPDLFDQHAFVALKTESFVECAAVMLRKAEAQCKHKFPGDQKCLDEANRAYKYCWDGLTLQPKRLLTVFTYPPIRIFKKLRKTKECMAWGNVGVLQEWCEIAYGQKGLNGEKGLNDATTWKNCEDSISQSAQNCRRAVTTMIIKLYDYKFDLQKVNQTGPPLVLPDIPPGK